MKIPRPSVTNSATSRGSDGEYSDDEGYSDDDDDMGDMYEEEVPALSFTNANGTQEEFQESIFSLDEGGMNSADDQEVYFTGIIDILQQYNSLKRAETFFKGFTHDAKEISAVEPRSYANRFIAFLERNSK